MNILAMALLALGTAFLLIAAVGVIRLRDPLQRMHSATKAGTLGTALLLLGVVLSDRIEGSAISAFVMLFLLVTLPIGAQLLGRASYLSGARLRGLKHDPLADEISVQRHDVPLQDKTDGKNQAT